MAGLLGRNTENNRIVLGLLESLERDSAQSQRRLAAELGVAVGLINIYVKRCVKKGLLKIAEAPARQYAYYLTPHGFAEKARLTLEFLSYSFDLFRRAKADCTVVFLAANARGFDRVALAGVSDLAEIARICALETGIEIVVIVDLHSSLTTFAGLPVVQSYDGIADRVRAIIVTDIKKAQETYAAAVQRFGAEYVLVPSLLGLETRNTAEVST
jgi:DNA-binding MarR family transcriptional regulator